MTKENVKIVKRTYPTGTAILLHEMSSDPNPIPNNTIGIVDFVDDMGQIHCTWFTRFHKRSLAISKEYGDDFEKAKGDGHVSTWEISGDGYYPYCTLCEGEPAYELLLQNETGKVQLPKRCPHCGAVMTNWDRLNKSRR